MCRDRHYNLLLLRAAQVEQLGEIQVLWIHRTYSTWLHVVEDARDPECLRIKFELLRSVSLAPVAKACDDATNLGKLPAVAAVLRTHENVGCDLPS